MLYIPIQLLLCILPSFSILGVDKRTIYNNKSVQQKKLSSIIFEFIAFIHM